jgi:hypothetical protein
MTSGSARMTACPRCSVWNAAVATEGFVARDIVAFPQILRSARILQRESAWLQYSARDDSGEGSTAWLRGALAASMSGNSGMCLASSIALGAGCIGLETRSSGLAPKHSCTVAERWMPVRVPLSFKAVRQVAPGALAL